MKIAKIVGPLNVLPVDPVKEPKGTSGPGRAGADPPPEREARRTAFARPPAAVPAATGADPGGTTRPEVDVSAGVPAAGRVGRGTKPFTAPEASVWVTGARTWPTVGPSVRVTGARTWPTVGPSVRVTGART